MFAAILEKVQKQTPLVHCITNYVTVNDVANIVLASGGSPIMSDDIGEVEEITTICNSLVINIGTLNNRTIESMIKAGKKANQLGHPVILDPVGTGASALRTETTSQLLKEVKFAVIRGNLSEIKTISQGSGNTKGVDADQADQISDNTIDSVISLAKKLSADTGAIIAITGAKDIVATANKAYVIANGHPLMTKITGTGCMLSAVVGSYCGANYENQQQLLEAAVTAVTAVGLCGELAQQKISTSAGGTSSLRTYLIDSMSQLTGERLEEGARIEVR